MISFGGRTGGIYAYYCLSGDVSDLAARAEKDNCGTGSSAYCVDTGDLYMYDAENKEWRKQ